MAAENGSKGNGRRRTLLDLAPLERDCMLALWPLGQGTVRQIREGMAATRPRAYTTIMTIMDRLAKKGVVTRDKVGRGYLYRPNFSEDELRSHAVTQLVEHFFGGSAAALQEHMKGGVAALRVIPVPTPAPPPVAKEPRKERVREEEAVAPAMPSPALDASLL